MNAPAAVTVVSPNGGEAWDLTVPHAVTWTDNLGGAVNIALYHNGLYSATLAYNTPSDGDYLWLPDSALAPGPGYSVRVTSVIGPAAADASDAAFTLAAPVLVARDVVVIIPDTLPVTLEVLSNDSAPHGLPLTITAVGPALSGTVSLAGAQLLYTPTLGLLGPDVFTYTVSTGADWADATVTVLVVAQVFRLFLPAVRR